jgi:hypothetical protein
MARIGPWRLLLFQHTKGNDERCGSDCNLMKAKPSPGWDCTILSRQNGPRQTGLPALCVRRLDCAFPGVGSREHGCLHCGSRVADMTFRTAVDPVQCESACAGIFPMVQTNHSCLPPKGKPEFHAEWLRDEPCDATTTCLGKPGVWCQLLPGDGEHEIRGQLSHSLR